MRRMAEEQLPNLNSLIDGLRTRLHEELEVQLRGMADSHARALDQARQAADAEAEDRCTARIEVIRGEWHTRLDAAVALARAEADRAAAAETMRVRQEVEHEAVASAAVLRRELEQAFAAERQHLQSELDAERRRAAELETGRQRAVELESELQGIAGERDAHRQRIAELEAEGHRQAHALQAERQRTAELQADQQRVMALDAERERIAGETAAQAQRISELEAEGQRLGRELESERQRVSETHADRQRVTELEADRARLEAQLVSARQQADDHVKVAREQADAELQAERERAARALAEARAAFASEPREPEIPAAPSAPAREHTSGLVDAIRALDQAGSLTEVLAAVVRGAAAEAERAAMFVVQGTELREWPIAGVPSVDSSPLRVDGRESGIIAEALRRRAPATTGAPDNLAAPFFATLPPGGVALAVPLLLGGTPVAVLYADEQGHGAGGPSWRDSVQILGRHAAACAASLTAVRTAQAMRFIAGETHDTGATATDPGDQIQAARRYARLLVSEIKLYNENAVRLGRERRDLLVRLEPEIARARRLFDDRVAASVEGRDGLFQQELAQTLADGDPSLLGEPGHQPSSWS